MVIIDDYEGGPDGCGDAGRERRNGLVGVCADASAVTVMGVMDMITVVLGVTAIVWVSSDRDPPTPAPTVAQTEISAAPRCS